MENFYCIKCQRTRSVPSARNEIVPGKGAGVTMQYKTAHCPRCHSKMMKVAKIIRTRR